MHKVSKFGTYRASATNVSSVSITSANPATIRICDFHRYGYRAFSSSSEFDGGLLADNFRFVRDPTEDDARAFGPPLRRS